MEIGFIVLIAALAIVGLLVLVLHMRAERGRGDNQEHVEQLTEATANLLQSQQELAGRMKQLSEQTAAERAELGRTMETRLDSVSKRLGDSLELVSKRLNEGIAGAQKQLGESLQQTATTTAESLGQLGKHLQVIDAAQKNIAELTGQVIGLQDILDNKQARGAFGEVQLRDLVSGVLPPSAYGFQVTLSNGRRVDCLVHLPNPPGAISIDSKFPLESYYALRNAGNDIELKQAQRDFRMAVLKHVNDISQRYIVAGETADSALMFLPSEAVYAELHANFADAVQQSYRAKVWIVSPTTLMATLNTVRAVLKDARMREQAGLIQTEVQRMLDDVRRLERRVENLRKHHSQSETDIREILTSTNKIVRRGGKIEDVQLEDQAEVGGALALADAAESDSDADIDNLDPAAKSSAPIVDVGPADGGAPATPVAAATAVAGEPEST